MAEDVKHVDRWEWCDVMRAYINAPDGDYVRAQDFDALRAEVDEARGLVIEANNSLYGSQGYFHSLNGGAYDRHHLSRGIEDLKTSSRARYAFEARAERLAEACDRLIAKWERQADEHGVRQFTGNDHKLFANELRAAIDQARGKAGGEVG